MIKKVFQSPVFVLILSLVLIYLVSVFFIIPAYNNYKVENSPQDIYNKPLNVINRSIMKYISLGDSYTIGTGVSPQDAWPNVFTKLASNDSIPIQLISNPARDGYSTYDVIEKELPTLPKKFDIATLMIGANDVVRSTRKDEFRSNLKIILDNVKSKVPLNRIYIITIPDFSKTPQGRLYVGSSGSELISSYNEIIKDVSYEYNITLIDIFPLTQNMQNNEYSIDELHPNEKGYSHWGDFIYSKIKPTLI